MPQSAPLLASGEKDMELRPRDAVELDASDAGMFERLAKDPTVDVLKLEKLIEMQERILRFNAKAAFEAAFAEMQGELPIVDERGRILVDGVERSTFGRHEDIQEACKPICARFGFSIRHKNKRLENGKLLITGVLSHKGGHSEEDEFECPPDGSGKKNEIQSLGSTREYGRRYTTISLLNIVTRGVDDDGRKAGAKPKDEPETPEGYDAWFATLDGLAADGEKAFTEAWKNSTDAHRKYLATTAPKVLAALNTKARKAKP
jgi:hypothetical protein